MQRFICGRARQDAFWHTIRKTCITPDGGLFSCQGANKDICPFTYKHTETTPFSSKKLKLLPQGSITKQYVGIKP